MDALKKLPIIILAALLCLCAARRSYAWSSDINVLLDANISGGTLAGSAMTLSDASGRTAEFSGSLPVSGSGASLTVGSKSFSLPLTVTSQLPISWNGVPYRGIIEFKAAAAGLRVSNRVDAETYLRGVVPIEMNKGWPIEALKAQAVLARTYAAASGKHGEYQVCDDGHCQIYKGAAKESPQVDAAIAETAGIILLWQGKPASVYYHSESGGMVTGAENVWGGRIPYLRPDAEPIVVRGPNAVWQADIPMRRVESKLASAGITVGSISSITPVRRDESGRVLTLEVRGSAGTKSVSGYKFRSIMGAQTIKSTLFEFGGRTDYAQTQSAAPEQPAPQPVSYTAPQKINITEMPTDAGKEEQLVWLTKKGIFTTIELMEMLSRPEMADSYIKTGIARAEGREPMPQRGTRSAGVPPPTARSAPAYTANLSMTPATGTTVQIFGRGYGHGVGLSQWGAKALAEDGWDYTRILGLYFPGTTTGQ